MVDPEIILAPFLQAVQSFNQWFQRDKKTESSESLNSKQSS